MISIITITYNNYDEFIKTISSIPKMDYVESVIINGGSCQRTREFLKSYTGTIISEKDNGISDAFNKGITNSSGIYIMFLNSGDELVDQSYLKKAKDFLNTNRDYSFVHSNINFIDESGEELFIRPPMKSIGRGMPYLHPTMIIRKKVFDEIGLFRTDLKIAMDYDFIVRMENAGLKGFYLDKIYPVKMEGTGKSVKQESEAIKECFKILRENNQLGLKNISGFSIRYFLFFLRKVLSVAGLNKLLLNMKKLKHKA